MNNKIRITVNIEEATMIKFLMSYGLDKVSMTSNEAIMVNKLIYVLENKIDNNG